MLKRKGFSATVVYLDDFFIKANTFHECLEALNMVINLLRKLGFHINWKKVTDPCTKIVFLGIEIDSLNMCLRLPDDKLYQICDELLLFQTRKRASKKQLQSLAGKLNFCAGVVFGGRVFLRRIIDSINLLKAENHKMKLTERIHADISWWQSFMSTFNGKSMLLDRQHIQSTFTDSCTQAGGGIYQGDWFYINWGLDWPFVSHLHINSKEILAAFLAVRRWAPCWKNKRIFIHLDNVTTVSAINKGTSRNPFIMACLRQLFWLSAMYNFHISARFLLGISNTVADDISRLHEPGRLEKIISYVHMSPGFPCTCLMLVFLLYFPDPRARKLLTAELDRDVTLLRSQTFAESTSRTYRSQLLIYLQFCSAMDIEPVPTSLANLERYIAFLASRLCFSSVRQYLNAVHLIHLEAGLPNPLINNWYFTSIMKGLKCHKGDSTKQKLPISVNILRGILSVLDFN